MKLLFEHFELLADAPNSIPKLRELILQLAVQGKLVKQDVLDEPIINTIHKANPKFQFEINNNDKTLPHGWLSTKVGEILSFEYGKSVPKANRIKSGGIPIYGANGILDHHDKFLVNSPVIIIGRKGSAGAVNKVYEPCWPSDVTYYVKPPKFLYFEYTFYLLKSLNLEDLAKGIKPGLNRNEAYKISLIIPPLPEQKRIVAKVEQLMALCDELEQKQETRSQKRIHLNNAALNKLLTVPGPEEFREHWQRIASNFELLYDAPETVTQLKQAILQLAVQGKLVKQDPADEPAGELLKRIRAEKERLIVEGEIKKEKPLPPISAEEIPYPLPEGWVWCRFGETTINRDGERIPVSKEERQNRFGPYDYYGASGVIDKIDDFLFDKDLLLIGEDGANLINRATPIAFIARGKYWVNNHAHVIDAIDFTLLDYLEIFINAIDLKPYVTGTAQPKMNQAKMNSILVSLPSLAEQKRIVAKVEELLNLCNTLEEQLTRARQKSERLMSAVAQGVVGN